MKPPQLHPRFRRTSLVHPVGVIAFALVTACASPDDGVVPPTDPTAAAREAPSPGSPGLGDELYATLGNGGYDVLHYDLALRYASAAPEQPIDGRVTIRARATQALSAFDLDFGGDAVGQVEVDGRPAAWRRDGDELVITPARPLRRGQVFEVEIEQFAATPTVPDPADFLGAPLFVHPDGSAWAAQPAGAHAIFPCNDHPRDKASFDFRIDVPAGTTAVANGEFRGSSTSHGRTVWRYRQRQPMATELAQVAVGDLTVIERGRHGGVDVRDVVPTRLAAELGPKLASVTAHLAWLQARLGDYPFDSYGSLAVDTSLGFALETQTLSLFEVGFFDAPAAQYEPIMVHELAHQWFGDSVAPTRWRDVWQNEGHATWYELEYQFAPDAPAFVGLMQNIYFYGDLLRAFYGPVGSPLSGGPIELFNPNVYYGGALTLFALRQEVGDTTFRAIERAWVGRNRGTSASTADFVALASQLAGRDLTTFMDGWLYGDTTPPMPGYPDWTTQPVTAATALAAPAVTASLERALPVPLGDLAGHGLTRW
ncbi:MAG: M1 family metallopeptidase [Kofleriaceae bacterium]